MHVLNIYFEKKGNPIDLFPSFCWTACKSQPLLDYFWGISRDWEKLQWATTLHGRLLCTLFVERSYSHNNRALDIIVLYSLIH